MCVLLDLLCRVQVTWSAGGGEEEFAGKICAYSAATETHLVKYEDGDTKWHNLLLEERMGILKWLDQPRRLVARHDDSTPHYIVYNADTRALFMYPNVCVLTHEDVADGKGFARRLSGSPHHLHVPHDHGLARQVFVKVTEPRCVEVAHTCSRHLAQLAGKYTA